MAERYTRLFALTENLYQTGSPVLIAAGALLKDTQSGRVLAQLKFQSLSDKLIKAAKVTITPLDVVGNELGSLIEHQYLDLSIRRDEEFGAKSPVVLPDATTRAFRATVMSVVFADNTVWSASNAAWEPLPSPVTLDKVYPDAELRKQFMLEFGAQSQCTYAEFADLCRCPCGTLNRQDEAKCHTCGCDLTALRELDIGELEKHKDERLEQERIAEEERQERKKKEAAEAAECAKKAKKIALIAAPIVCVVIAFLIVLNSVIIPNVKYNNAVTLMEAGQYEEAIEAFEAMDGYKDSAEKLDECAVAILDAAYDTAVAWMELGDYETAIEGFEILGDYRDSADCLVECQYCEAIVQMETGDYYTAFEFFQKIADYKDSAEKIKECEIPMLKTAEIGDYVYFGSYEQDNDSSNGTESIEWLVLDIQDGRAFLLSKYALDVSVLCPYYMDFTWETCTLRQWLNNDFLNSAFSMEEKSHIPTVAVSADSESGFRASAGNDTQDKVFLLSAIDATEYFESDRKRQCKPTDYVAARGGFVNNVNGNCGWWLRSPGIGQDQANYVNHDGRVRAYGDAGEFGYAVRPAIWVDFGG